MGDPVGSLRGLGPRSAAWLAEAGVRTEDDLEALGVVEAFRRVAAARPGVSLNLLWALWGALHGMDWRDVPPDVKADLRRELGR